LCARDSVIDGHPHHKPSPLFPGEFSEQKGRRTVMKITVVKFGLIAGSLLFAGATNALAQKNENENPPSVAQIVALDECDPVTFNAALGAGFCKNVTLGAFTKLPDLFAKAKAGTPDPGWDFEPDTLHIKKGATLIVVDQGGEPHTFTEVAQFGGGFIPGLNAPGENTVPECAGGFSKVAVAKTRILQGSHVQITGLSQGEHLFECCIHPWMRVKVEVK
jgi:plastocyanin